MDIKAYVQLLLRWMWLIILGGLLAGTTAYVLSRQATPVYASSTTLLINQVSSDSTAPDYNSLLTSERLAKTYGELLQKRPVVEAVIAALKLDTLPEALAKKIDVTVAQDTQLIVLTVEDTNPQRAADIANEIVQVFSQQNREMQLKRYTGAQQNLQQELVSVRSDIDQAQTKLDTLGSPKTPEQRNQRQQLQAILDQNNSMYDTLLKNLGEIRLAESQLADNLSVVESATPQLIPVRPRVLLNTLLAIIFGMLLATGLALTVEYLDDSVKTRSDVEKLIGASTLASVGGIPGVDPVQRFKLAADRGSVVGEGYRRLRANIEFSAVDRPVRTLVITSAGSGEGKSTTAANLAIAIAQTGKRVILVDTDLRQPVLHTLFERGNDMGVTTALLDSGAGTLDQHLITTKFEHLRLMPSGPLPPNPAELLSWARMVELIDNLKAEAEVVIFDTPPLLTVIDAALLARVCDATLLVVQAGKTRANALMQAKAQLIQSGTRLLGVMLNRAGETSKYRYSRLYPRMGSQQPTLRLPFLSHGKQSSSVPMIDASNLASVTHPVQIDRSLLQKIEPQDDDTL